MLSLTTNLSGLVKAMALFFFCNLTFSTLLPAQIDYTANDVVQPYEGKFRFGMNLGYYSGWWDARLGDIAAGNPEMGLKGVGVNTSRPSLYEYILEDWGYESRLPAYEHWAALGIEENTVIIGGPAYSHRDHTHYCPEHESKLFANLYDDIWDGGANGTPVNDDNYFALYLYKVATDYKDYIKIWEIWNEPDFDFSSSHWYYYDTSASWWVSNPDPCDYQLRAPIFHYVRILRIAWEVIKYVDPEAYVSIGALGYPHFLDAVLRNTDNPIDGSVTSEYPLGGGAYFDVMSYHIYPHIDGTLWDYDRPSNSITGFHRHSDSAIKGIVRKKLEFQEVLEDYGYDGNIYPEKIWNITEANVPRQGYGDHRYYGSNEHQRNFIIKAAVVSQKLDVIQMHAYQLSDRETEAEADSEFHTMGMYKSIADVDLEDVEVTDVGIAYKTVSDMLYGWTYDAEKTEDMDMPADVDGGAFANEEGEFTYVLWAKTTIDRSENANADYSFPSSFGLEELNLRRWNFSETENIHTVDADDIDLTGAPVFLKAAEGDSGGGSGGGNETAEVDLSLKLTIDNSDLEIYKHRTYSLTLTNSGTEAASGIEVDFPLPDGLVFSDESLTQGTYSDWSGVWRVGDLAGGSVASLELVLYTLTDEGPIVSYAQVTQANGDDIDSTPGNGTCCTPNEDDEAAVILGGDNSGGGNGGENEEEQSDGVDLEISLTADKNTYLIYQHVLYQLRVKNTGNETATNIQIDCPIPDGLVFSSQTLSMGSYRNWNGLWKMDALPTGGEAVMDLKLFTMTENEPISVFAEVKALDQEDIDSSPDNAVCSAPSNCEVNEDDEASWLLTGADGFHSSPVVFFQAGVPQQKLVIHRVFPNPVEDKLQVYFSASENDLGWMIYDTKGQVQLLGNWEVQNGFNEKELKVEDLPTGVYYLWVEGQHGRQPVRFVKVRG